VSYFTTNCGNLHGCQCSGQLTSESLVLLAKLTVNRHREAKELHNEFCGRTAKRLREAKLRWFTENNISLVWSICRSRRAITDTKRRHLSLAETSLHSLGLHSVTDTEHKSSVYRPMKPYISKPHCLYFVSFCLRFHLPSNFVSAYFSESPVPQQRSPVKVTKLVHVAINSTFGQLHDKSCNGWVDTRWPLFDTRSQVPLHESWVILISYKIPDNTVKNTKITM
jgi:hypothetical protein